MPATALQNFAMNDIAAILLAAGRSRRMGAFKPLLPFGNRTVIETCIANLRAADVSDIIVVVGHRADDLRQHLRSLNVLFALNTDAESEMSVSIARGVEQVSEDAKALLISLADHPAVPGDTIREIIDEWKRGARLVQPEHKRRGGHPVLIDLAYRDELLQLDPQTGLRCLFETHREEVRRLPVDSPYIARDMDTWEDYIRLHEEVFGRPPSVDVSLFS
jgi:molybdenum cofactor cytidylyltransferase